MSTTNIAAIAPKLERSAHPPVLPRPGASRMFDASILSGPQAAIEFITNVLQSSTEYSIIGKDLDGGILLWNADAGAGIAPEDQDKLFRAFGQFANRARPEECSGLGLHINQKLAHLIGGRITFESVHGHGSSFTLSLQE